MRTNQRNYYNREKRGKCTRKLLCPFKQWRSGCSYWLPKKSNDWRLYLIKSSSFIGGQNFNLKNYEQIYFRKASVPKMQNAEPKRHLKRVCNLQQVTLQALADNLAGS